MTSEVTGNVNGLSSEQTAKGQAISPCTFCSGNHWNDSCSIYPTAGERKQLLKYKCYICLKSGHRAFECKIQKICYFCGRRNHHHRSICEVKFGNFQNVRGHYGNMAMKFKEDSSTKTSCKLQVVDSEDEVYISLTSMEAELALTVKMNQEELERCKNENILLKQMISKLESEKETMQKIVRENAEKTKGQCKEITQLKGRIEKLESNGDAVRSTNQMNRFTQSEPYGINTERYNESQIQSKEQRMDKSTNRYYTVEEQEMISNADQDLGEINMMINKQEHLQNRKYSHCDSQPHEKKHAYAWSKLIDFMTNNINLPEDMYHY